MGINYGKPIASGSYATARSLSPSVLLHGERLFIQRTLLIKPPHPKCTAISSLVYWWGFPHLLVRGSPLGDLDEACVLGSNNKVHFAQDEHTWDNNAQRKKWYILLFIYPFLRATTRRLLAPLLALSVSVVVVRGVRLDALIACTRLGCARSRQDKQSSAPCETQPLCREPLCGVFVISHRTLAPRAMRDWIVIAASTAPPLTVWAAIGRARKGSAAPGHALYCLCPPSPVERVLLSTVLFCYFFSSF